MQRNVSQMKLQALQDILSKRPSRTEWSGRRQDRITRSPISCA